MATWTAETLRNRALEHIGIKPAGQAARAEDASLVDDAVTAAHAQLRSRGLAPYPTSAIPEWAQIPLRDYVAGDIGPAFGFGNAFKPGQMAAENAMYIQCTVEKPPLAIKCEAY
jgi:hypothetical protein